MIIIKVCVILVMIVNELVLNVNVGNTNDLKVLNPAEGNQPSLAANTRINIKPNQKFGIDTPINAATTAFPSFHLWQDW